jgi:PAS domain S-box-containing protein
MDDEQKTKEQFIEEIRRLRSRIEELEHLEREHKKCSQTLVESNKKLSMMIEHLPGMGYSCLNDENWTMTFVSSGCKELTGYSSEDLVENKTISFNEVIHPSDRAYVREHVEDALEKKQPWRLLYRIKTAQGEERWVWEKGVGVFNEQNELLILLGYIMPQAG